MVSLCWCLLQCLLSGSNVAAMFTNGGTAFGVYTIATLWSLAGVPPGDSPWPTAGVL